MSMNSANEMGPRSAMARRIAASTGSLGSVTACAPGRPPGARRPAALSLRHNPPVEPRPAATVVVVRPGPRGVEVLMLRRAPDTPFAAGFVVFPGGMVDDADADLAERWFDDAGDAASSRTAHALEAGLVMGGDG